MVCPSHNAKLYVYSSSMLCETQRATELEGDRQQEVGIEENMKTDLSIIKPLAITFATPR
jgi:hypothetical protein